MNQEISIRKAEAGDAAAIAQFNMLIARETEDKELEPQVALDGVKAIFTDPSKGFYLVALSGADIVGQLMVTDEWSDWRNKYFLWIQSVYVRQEFRKNKVFSKLYHHLLDMAKKRDDVGGLRLYVEKNNNVAKRVYEVLGMSKTIYDLYEIEF